MWSKGTFWIRKKNSLYFYFQAFLYCPLSFINKIVDFLKICKLLVHCCVKYEETIKFENLISYYVVHTCVRWFNSYGHRLVSLTAFSHHWVLTHIMFTVHYLIPHLPMSPWQSIFIYFGILHPNTTSWYCRCSIMTQTFVPLN